MVWIRPQKVVKHYDASAEHKYYCIVHMWLIAIRLVISKIDWVISYEIYSIKYRITSVTSFEHHTRVTPLWRDSVWYCSFRYTVRFRYNAVQYHVIFHTPLYLLAQNINQSLDSHERAMGCLFWENLPRYNVTALYVLWRLIVLGKPAASM